MQDGVIIPLNDYVEKYDKITYLRQSLINLVLQGVTTMDELLKVTYYVQ